MNPRRVVVTAILAALILLVAAWWTLAPRPPKPDPAVAQARRVLDDLSRQAASGGLVRVTLYYLPEEILTRTAVSPERLEVLARLNKHNASGLALSGTANPATMRALPGAAAGTRLTAWTDRGGDFRYGAVFYDRAGRRAFSLFMTPVGAARLNGTPIGLSGGIATWLRTAARGMDRRGGEGAGR